LRNLPGTSDLRLALFEPDIPQNTGALLRLAACFGVAVDLIDADNGAHLWAEKYDRDAAATSLFALQDDLTDHIVATVADNNGVLVWSMAAGLRDRPAGFRVLSGDDAVTLPLIALGADGIVSVVSNETPDLMANLTESALRGDWEIARELHYRLLPLMEANFLESNPGPVKAALTAMGLLEEHVRLPLVPVQEQTRARVRAVLGALGLLPGAAHVAA